MGGIPDMPAHILKMDGTAHGPRRSPSGRLGDPAKVSARIELQAVDPHSFDIAHLDVRVGQTIEIVLHNIGSVRHELVIGDRAQQEEYARIVKAMSQTRHEHENVLVVEPGKTRSVVWEFGDARLVELACHIEGHYEQGMVVRVTVQP